MIISEMEQSNKHGQDTIKNSDTLVEGTDILDPKTNDRKHYITDAVVSLKKLCPIEENSQRKSLPLDHADSVQRLSMDTMGESNRNVDETTDLRYTEKFEKEHANSESENLTRQILETPVLITPPIHVINSDSDNVRRIWKRLTALCRNVSRRSNCKVFLLIGSIIINIVLIVFIAHIVSSGSPPFINSTQCFSESNGNDICISCSNSLPPNNTKSYQRYRLSKENTICCFQDTQFANIMMILMQNERKRTITEQLKYNNAGQIPRQSFISIHRELPESHILLKGGHLNWTIPQNWNAPRSRITYRNGIFTIPVTGYYAIYESLATKYLVGELDNTVEYLRVQISRNGGKTNEKILLEQKIKRWTGIQVYQGLTSIATFYLEKGDDVELVVSKPDLIIYKNRVSNSFGLYKI